MVNKSKGVRRPAASTRVLLKQLAAMRDSFGDDAAAMRLSLIGTLSKQRILNPEDLISYHDLLCFVRAYPDSPALLSASEKELKAFGKRVADYKRLTRDKLATELDDTGIDGSITCYQFNYDITRYLLERYPKQIRINWEHSHEEIWYRLGNLLGLLVTWQENDPIDTDDNFDPQKFFAMSGGKKDELRALVNLFAGSGLQPKIIRDYWESLGLLIDWDLTGHKSSRTLHRVEMEHKFYQTEPLRGRTKDLRREIEGRASALHTVPAPEGEELLNTINEALGIRNRELFPLTFGNAGEVYTIDPGRGARFVLYGSTPDARLPLESNFGALLIRNGMPVGYGVAAVLFDRAEIAINIFPNFRGGESPYFMEQFFRAFYHHFGSRTFVVRAKQMGYGEEEALLSGAFWFYYKLGFRACDKDIRKLADAEYKKILAKPRYRVPTSMMTRLSKTDVFFTIDPESMHHYQELSLTNLGYRVTEYFGEKFTGDRKAGVSEATAQLTRELALENVSRWSDGERLALSRLAPLFVQIPDISRWTADDKRLLAEIIRAKGGPREREYVLLMNQHTKLRRALEALAK